MPTDDDAGASAAPPAREALLREALAGAGTFVWEWHIDSDLLSDTDDRLALLGHQRDAIGPTQEDWNRLIHPDDLAANHEAYLRHARGEVETYEHTYRARAADGAWRWLRERGRIVERDAAGRPRRMLGTQTDVTERRALEQAAGDAQQRLEMIARHAPGMLFQYEIGPDRRDRFRYVSEAIRDLFGLSPEQAMRDPAQAWASIEADDRAGILDSLNESARTLGEWRCSYRARPPGGPQRWLMARATPQREADGTVVWYGTVTDLTERRELEQARQDALLAQLASRAKTEFLSRMSHELRTPLNAVLGFTQLIASDQGDPPSEGQQRRLKLVLEAGEHLLQMIGDLLDMSRIEAGGMALRLEPLALRAAAAEAIEMLRDSAERATVTLALADDGDDALVQADRTRLRQVLLNLLSNAVKYNRPGGRVDVAVLQPGDGTLRLDVRDTGIGIAAADLPRLFDPFYRGQQPAGRSVDGAGIGLSVTQALVSLLGGRIEVQSTPGVGTTFSVTLPAAPGAGA